MLSTPVLAGADAAQTVPADERGFGRYVLRYKLGAGGMASVYLGCQKGPGGFERLVAIKRIHPHLVEDPRFVEMFLDEARIASRVSHPNVCAVHDFGEEAGAYFMALEYLSGVSLNRVMRDAAASPRVVESLRFQGLVAHVGHEVAEGLHAAHETRDADGTPLHVVHRDVSPHNIVLTFGGGVKIVDFGIAQARRRIRGTATGTLKGKLPYMAPEHASGQSVDRRADIWALGVVLWEMLTGTRLFKKTNEMATLLAVRSMPIPRVSSIVPSVPPDLDRIVARALSRDLDERYPTARELARDLAGFLQQGTVPFGRIELSEWLAERFARERREDETRMHEIVVAASEVDRTASRVDVTESAPSVHEAQTALLPFGASEPTPGETSPLPDPPTGAGRRRLTVVVVALGLAAAVAGAGLGLYTQRPDEPAQEVARRPEPIAPQRAEHLPPEEPAPTVAPREPEPPSEETPPVVETSEAEEARPTPSKRARRREPRRHAPAPAEAPGRLNLVTVGGWADVYLGARRIGQTPLAGVSLPAGRHRLRLVPSGGRPARTVVVDIRPDDITRAQVELD